ncbi:MAG: hypothetical protein WBO73_00435 [Gammaproteobacteria bacterium]|jgi:uncharacterized low-complexity protein
MSDKSFKKPLAIAMGATFAAALSASPVANADSNPFGMQNLSSGYMQLAEGKCGEGKCGGKSEKEGKCGEGKCGGKSEKEGKCGEGKCGGMKEKEKEKEGKCGEGKCGGKD